MTGFNLRVGRAWRDLKRGFRFFSRTHAEWLNEDLEALLP